MRRICCQAPRSQDDLPKAPVASRQRRFELTGPCVGPGQLHSFGAQPSLEDAHLGIDQQAVILAVGLTGSVRLGHKE